MIRFADGFVSPRANALGILAGMGPQKVGPWMDIRPDRSYALVLLMVSPLLLVSGVALALGRRPLPSVN